jgi:AcrR family transcriptional regulator
METSRKAGRPPSTTREEILAIARGLFYEQGYDNTSLQEIANKIGISRTSLFSYFPSKADLIMGEYDEIVCTTEEVFGELKISGKNLTISESVEHAIMSAFGRFSAEDQPSVSLRWDVMDNSEILNAESLRRFYLLGEYCAEFIAHRIGQESKDYLPSVVGHTVYSAMSAAGRAWTRLSKADVPMMDYVLQAIRPIMASFQYDLDSAELAHKARISSN